jgi:biopolymer transport protein ExbD
MVEPSSELDAFDDLEDSDDSSARVTMPARPPMDDEMDITPMIDMTFLLLIFFILTSKMTAEQTFSLPSAKNGEVIPTKQCVILNVRSGGGETAIVTRGDDTALSDDPEQQAAEITEYIQLGFSTQKSEVLVRADGAVRAGEIQRLKEVISESLEEGQVIHFGVINEP